MKAGVLAEPGLVGREPELEELQLFLDSAFEGKGKTVFVSGEAGAGKTRLINEFLSRANKKAIIVLSGWCLSDAAVPYLPFAEAFRTHFSANEEEPIESQMAGELQPLAKLESAGFEEYGITAWLSGLSHPVRPTRVAPASPQVWKDQLFTAVAETLHAMSTKQPVVLIIEDVHWADSASLALLHYIARVINDAERILVLASFRSEELTIDAEGRPHPLSETLRLMRREELLKEICLSSLNQACVSRMAESMMGASLEKEFVGKLAAESKGNPLFVVESLRMLHEGKSLFQENDEWRLSVDELGIPNKIKDIILRRLAALKHAERRILDAASVIGEEFNVELISAVLGQDSLDVIEKLNLIAQSTSIVRVEEASYRFDHARSREVLYETLSLPLKRGYHARIAERLEAQSKSDALPLADLAYHYAQAQDEEKAVKYSLAAGKEELARWSNTEAAKHFQYVLQEIGDSPERFNERTIALEGLGDAYYASDNFKQAADVFDKLAVLLSGADKLRALRKAMFAAFYLGDISLLTKLTQTAEENATADRLEAARVLHQKARIFAIHGDYATVLGISEEALRVFEEEYALSDAAWILFTIGANRSQTRYELGVAAGLRSIALYDELGDNRSQLEAYLYMGITFGIWWLFEEGQRMFDRVIESNEKLRMNDYIRLIPAYAFSSFYLSRVSIPDSISKALKALDYAEKTDSSLYSGFIHGLLTIEYAYAEDTVHMDEHFGKLVNLPEDVLSNTFSKTVFNLAMGMYYAAKNEFEKSNSYFSKILRNTTSTSSALAAVHKRFYAWALSRQGRTDEAQSQLELRTRNLESSQERTRHVNVQASLMTFTHPQACQTFEVRLDLVNVSRSRGSIVKVENLLAPGIIITNSSTNCLINDAVVELREKTIQPFEVKTIKLTAKATKPEVFRLHPTVTYVDDLGETKTCSTRPFIITVQPDRPKFEVLPGRVPTGFAELDALLFGGIPEHYAVALTSPSTDERKQLVRHFLEAGATTGETTFYVTTETGSAKILATKYPSNFYLFACNPQADAMIQSLPNVFKLKGIENLTDIDIALTKAFRTPNPTKIGPKRICLEIISDVLLQHHAVVTRKWLSALLPLLKSKGFTVLAVIDPQMHPPEEVQAILDLIDGEIRISERETAQATERILRVKKIVGRKYLENGIVLRKEELEQ